MNLFSVEFALCFGLFWIVYYALNHHIRAQKTFILAFSYLFLGLAGLKFLLINVIFSFIVYKFALHIHVTKSKFSLIVAIALIVALLAFFKFNVFFEMQFGVFKVESFLLPLGLSFYSFMSIALLVDTYTGELDEPSLLDTLLFLSFFAVIISGPILRARPFFAQLNSPKIFSRESEIYTLLVLALIKKLLIANHLYAVITPVFQAPAAYTTGELVAALFGYSVMLYCDFSGYVDFVRALGLMCGLNLPNNFARPFAAPNLKLFWQRWHITLMEFFKRLIYIPMGGSRGDTFATQFNVLVVFVISGLWHGAGLNFIIWGMFHGLGVVFLNLTAEREFIKFEPLKIFATFCFVSLVWLFFVMDIGAGVRYMLAMKAPDLSGWFEICAVFAVTFGFTFCYLRFDLRAGLERMFGAIGSVLSALFLAVLGFAIYFFMPSGMPNFIYQGF